MSMSTGRGVPAPLCQGFLKKRKDKMLDLRGQYYIYEVQSVREVNRSDNNRYLFEITMKNGKKKMLAADSADVRQEWMDQLWKAMLLSGPDRSGSISNGEVVSENSHETGESNPESRSIGRESFRNFTDEEMQESLAADNEIEQSTEEFLLTDNDYDILTPRKPAEEPIYDTPLSKWPANQGQHEATESIYDVPNALIRKLTEHTVESDSSIERPESSGLLNDMIACLDGESAAWVKTAPL